MARHDLDSGHPTGPRDADPQRSFSLACPKCKETMRKVQADRVTIDQCPGCGALWFDQKELEALEHNKKAARAIDVGATQRTDHRIRTTNLDCPRDSTRMAEKIYPEQSHIHVMECPMCHGRLLDAGEFLDVTKFSLGERLRHFFS